MSEYEVYAAIFAGTVYIASQATQYIGTELMLGDENINQKQVAKKILEKTNNTLYKILFAGGRFAANKIYND